MKFPVESQSFTVMVEFATPSARTDVGAAFTVEHEADGGPVAPAATSKGKLTAGYNDPSVAVSV
jgi:hypothetical protein